MLPRFPPSVADVHAARTEEKVGHSIAFGCAQGRRDDGVVREMSELSPTPEVKVSATGKRKRKNHLGAALGLRQMTEVAPMLRRARA